MRRGTLIVICIFMLVGFCGTIAYFRPEILIHSAQFAIYNAKKLQYSLNSDERSLPLPDRELLEDWSNFDAKGYALYQKDVRATAEKYSIPPHLLLGMVLIESKFHPLALSRSDAAGLTQIVPTTARELGVINVLDPIENIDAGARYLKTQLERFKGDNQLALAAYNAGPAAVRKADGIPPFRETQRYVARVINASAFFERVLQ